MSTNLRCPRCGNFFTDDRRAAECPVCGANPVDDVLPPSTWTAEPDAPDLPVTEELDAPEDGSHGALPSPEELAGRFPELEVSRLLGRGGMGAVYLARQKALHRWVALKIMLPASTRKPRFAERFAREARTLAQLNHPHIVAVHDFGEREGLCYLTMEYVEGVNLRELMTAGDQAEETRLSARRVLEIVPQICDALQYAHDRGVVHRDIKPENILVDRHGCVKIADFGLAKLATGGSRDAETLTASHQVLGTLRYMAPEQLQGAGHVDHRADIYALGVLFYELLTGQTPQGRFEPPSRRANVDARLDEVVLKALEQDPERRYSRAGQLKEELHSIASASDATNPRAVRKGTSSAPERNRQSRNRWLRYAGLTALIAGLLLAAGFAVRSWSQRQLPTAARAGDLPLVKRCLLLGARTEKLDREDMTPLMQAAWEGRRSVVDYLLTRGAEVDATNRFGETALMKAAFRGHTPVLEALLEGGADRNRRDRDGQTALARAAANGETAAAQLLLGAGASVDTADEDGMTPLMWAAWFGQDDVVRLLLDQGASLDARSADGENALMKAAYRGHVAAARRLVDGGSPLDAQDRDGETALALASSAGHLEIVQILLARRPDVDRTTHSGATPLMCATTAGHAAVVASLIEAGADVNARMNRGESALDVAVRQAGAESMVELLLDAGAVPSGPVWLWRGFQAAAQGRAEEAVDFLQQAAGAAESEGKGSAWRIFFAGSLYEIHSPAVFSHLALGEAHRRCQQPEPATEAFRQALQALPAGRPLQPLFVSIRERAGGYRRDSYSVSAEMLQQHLERPDTGWRLPCSSQEVTANSRTTTQHEAEVPLLPAVN